jgi:hypothetical protein
VHTCASHVRVARITQMPSACVTPGCIAARRQSWIAYKEISDRYEAHLDYGCRSFKSIAVVESSMLYKSAMLTAQSKSRVNVTRGSVVRRHHMHIVNIDIVTSCSVT